MPTRTRQTTFTRCLGWLAVATVALTGTLQARTFTSTDGRTLEADVVKIEGERPCVSRGAFVCVSSLV